MKEEDKIRKTLGTENPFRVPEGYFEQLTSEVMDRLPEKEHIATHETTMWERIRPLLYMTAMFIGAALIIRVASSHYTPQADNSEVVATVGDEEAEMEYIDMAMENTMMDDYSLYVYLADAEGE